MIENESHNSELHYEIPKDAKLIPEIPRDLLDPDTTKNIFKQVDKKDGKVLFEGGAPVVVVQGGSMIFFEKKGGKIAGQSSQIQSIYTNGRGNYWIDTKNKGHRYLLTFKPKTAEVDPTDSRERRWNIGNLFRWGKRN